MSSSVVVFFLCACRVSGVEFSHLFSWSCGFLESPTSPSCFFLEGFLFFSPFLLLPAYNRVFGCFYCQLTD